jgi:hypothetical protein
MMQTKSCDLYLYLYPYLQVSRTLRWAWNDTLQAFATSVRMSGVVTVERYVISSGGSVADTSTRDSLTSVLDGSVWLLSPTFPGPGFSGK